MKGVGASTEELIKLFKFLETLGNLPVDPLEGGILGLPVKPATPLVSADERFVCVPGL